MMKNDDGSCPDVWYIEDLPDGSNLVFHESCGKEHSDKNGCPDGFEITYPKYASW